MKFLIDENLPISLKEKLSEKWYEVFDIRETGNFGMTDEEIIKIASLPMLVGAAGSFQVLQLFVA